MEPAQCSECPEMLLDLRNGRCEFGMRFSAHALQPSVFDESLNKGPEMRTTVLHVARPTTRLLWAEDTCF